MATCAKCGGTFDESAGACPACMAATAQGAPAPPVPPPAKSSSTKVIVFILLGVLGVLLLGCLAVLAAIAIPNFLAAKERAVQKRTMSEVRSLATAVQSFQVDTNVYPDSHGRVVPVAELEALCDEVTQAQSGAPSDFVQSYAGPAALAQADGTPYYYAGNGEHFLIIALGSDQKCDGDLDRTVGAWMGPWPEEGPPLEPRTTSCYESDIVWGDYDWLSEPLDRQRHCGDLGGHDPPPQFGEPN